MIAEHDIQDTELPLELSEKLLLRLEICPKCQYQRISTDDALTSSYECPKCGIIYALALEEIERRNRGLESQDMAEVHAAQLAAEAVSGVKTSQVSAAMFVSQPKSSAWVYILLVCTTVGLGIYAWW